MWGGDEGPGEQREGNRGGLRVERREIQTRKEVEREIDKERDSGGGRETERFGQR